MASELVAMDHPLMDLGPGSFVLFELNSGRKILGTFRGWVTYEFQDAGGTATGGDLFFSIEAPNGAVIEESASSIVRGWYAPMGYRL